MKPITIRGLPPKVEREIRRRASEKGLSVNRVAVELLERATGFIEGKPKRAHHDLDDLSGRWSAEEARDFERALAEQRAIEEEIWR